MLVLRNAVTIGSRVFLLFVTIAYISPCWFLLRLKDQSFELIGHHDVDINWMKDVKSGNRGTHRTKFVPRVLFEGWKSANYKALFGSQQQQTILINSLVSICKTYEFDGVVLDTGYLGMRLGDPVTEADQVEFYRTLANQLHANNWKFILVQPPAIPEYNLFSTNEFMKIQSFVDYVSLMTYDYSHSVGPNSPVHFIVKTIFALIPPEQRSNVTLTSKLLLGTPFYGYDFESNSGEKQPVLGKAFVQLLQKHKPKIQWEEGSHEHYLTYKDKTTPHTVYYPTPLSVAKRTELAEELGVGISIWEIGQGLMYFYDLL